MQGLCRWLTPPGTQVSELSWQRLLLAGGVGGMLGWLSIYPVDVIKTKFQDTAHPIGGTPSCISAVLCTAGPP